MFVVEHMDEFTRIRLGIRTRGTVPDACTLSVCGLDLVVQVIVFLSAFVLEGQTIILGERFHHSFKALITRGHGIASGQTKDPRFPGGTLSMQLPLFKDLGLDISCYFPGTLNLSVQPYSFRLGVPIHSFPQVKWSSSLPPENFSFYQCKVRLLGEIEFIEGLVYWPHPSTKPEFYQDPHVLEVIAPRIPLAEYGKEMEICGNFGAISFFQNEG